MSQMGPRAEVDRLERELRFTPKSRRHAESRLVRFLQQRTYVSATRPSLCWHGGEHRSV